MRIVRVAVIAALACGAAAVASEQPAYATDSATLDGTYRLYFDGSGSTVNSVPVYITTKTLFYAIRSACLADGCVANATRLSAVDESSSAPGSLAGAYAESVTFRFTDGQWVRLAPYQRPCGDGQQSDWLTEWTLTPHGSGVLTGTRTDTPKENLCRGDAGGVLTEPITATRERGVDPGVDVAIPT